MSLIELKAITTNNHGVAHKTTALQFPLYPAEIQDALQAHLNQQMHFGTINIRPELPVILPLASFDLDTGEKKIKWDDDWVSERFRFKKCALVVKGVHCPAWIYCASSSSNNVDPYLLEIITVFVPDLEPDSEVVLRFENACVINAIRPL